jgi:hypothetical protein
MQQLIILYSGTTSQKSLTHIIDGDRIKILVKEDEQVKEVFTGRKFDLEGYAHKSVTENENEEIPF